MWDAVGGPTDKSKSPLGIGREERSGRDGFGGPLFGQVAELLTGNRHERAIDFAQDW